MTKSLNYDTFEIDRILGGKTVERSRNTTKRYKE
jgi:hypothetical protein